MCNKSLEADDETDIYLLEIPVQCIVVLSAIAVQNEQVFYISGN